MGIFTVNRLWYIRASILSGLVVLEVLNVGSSFLWYNQQKFLHPNCGFFYKRKNEEFSETMGKYLVLLLLTVYYQGNVLHLNYVTFDSLLKVKEIYAILMVCVCPLVCDRPLCL